MCGPRGEKNAGAVCKGRGARLPRLRNTRSGARWSRRAVCTECRLRGGTAMHLLQQCAPPAYPPPAKCIQWFIRRPPVQNQPCARARCVCVSTRANQHLARRRQRRRDRERIFPRADSRHTADKKSCGETWRGRDDESVGNKEWRKINGIVHGSPDYFGNRFWIFFFGNWGDGVAGEGT